MKRFSLALCSLLLFAHGALAEAIPVHVATKKGNVDLTLELATTPPAREHGLMDRKTLTPYDGMLFIFSKANRVSFWMKNTLIPLDMLFIDPKGNIVALAAHTTPLSLDEIDSTKPVDRVIELGGGAAARAGIAIGDKVTYALPPTVHVD